MRRFQQNVKEWVIKSFGIDNLKDTKTRTKRFLEESLELAQSLGLTEKEAMYQLKYVYGRPIGEPYQELGGTVVTLFALAISVDLDVKVCSDLEYNRIIKDDVIEKIRSKEISKLSRDYSFKLMEALKVNDVELINDINNKCNSIINTNINSSTGKKSQSYLDNPDSSFQPAH